MPRVSPIARQRPIEGRASPRAQASATDAVAATGTALVPVARSPSIELEDPRRSTRRNASFLAHLIATEQQLPQTRILRRAEPRVAARAYGAAARLVRPRS